MTIVNQKAPLKGPKAVLLLAIFFLVPQIARSDGLISGAPPLALCLNESANISTITFKDVYGVLCLSMLIYKLDAVNRFSKGIVADEIIKHYDVTPSAIPGLNSDIDNINVGRKGWTRYYPFSIRGRQYIARIFLTDERAYQREITVLYEARFNNPPVTLQIIPGLNTLLRGCDIKPYDIYDRGLAAICP